MSEQQATQLLGELAALLAGALAPLLAAELAQHSQPAQAGWETSRLLTLDELVAQLPAGKKPETWKRWLYERSRRGEIPGCVKLGGSLFFDPAQVHAWLTNPTPNPTGSFAETEQQSSDVNPTNSPPHPRDKRGDQQGTEGR